MFQRRSYSVGPPIFADLLLDLAGEIVCVNVESPSWLEDVESLYPHCARIGLIHRHSKQRAWLVVDDKTPRYFSQVNGQISNEGHRQYRTACVTNGAASVWLHSNGTIEVGVEPEVIYG